MKGFSAFEILIALVVTSLFAALSVKPLTGYVKRIQAKNAFEGAKHYLMLARSRAIANPGKHCGVEFRLYASNSKHNDSAIAFFDLNANKAYDVGKDSVYGKPFIFKKSEKLTAKAQGASPKVIVFRGDGSANASMKIDLTLGHIKGTLDVLASTGRIKVEMK
jgi:Tfp pilus assembly protein FimT